MSRLHPRKVVRREFIWPAKAIRPQWGMQRRTPEEFIRGGIFIAMRSPKRKKRPGVI